jgi:hypothetical protein
MTGWWLTYPSEKYANVSWDDYSQLNGKLKHVPNHQDELKRTNQARIRNQVKYSNQVQGSRKKGSQLVLFIWLDLRNVSNTSPKWRLASEGVS